MVASDEVKCSTKEHKVLVCVFMTTRSRTCPLSRPNTPTMGGRSLSYVPRPRRLLARRRGGSCESPCQSPFFPRILEHFVGFDFQIAQRRLRLRLLGAGLQLMPDFGGSGSTDSQFTRQ